MIEKLRCLPPDVEAVVADLSDAQLDTPYGPGKWTVRQVVHHLAESHGNAFFRFKKLLTEDNPDISAYNQDAWAACSDHKMPLEPSLAILRGLHARLVALLLTLPDDAWKRSGVHEEDGRITVDWLLRAYSEHGERHIGQIVGLRKLRGW
jgi:hypothetical protein